MNNMTLIAKGKTNWKFLLIVFILAVIVGGGVLWLTKQQVLQYAQPPEIKVPEEVIKNPTGFCGSSTYGICSSDSDCVTGGCSSEVCQSKNEAGAVSPCIYKDCENAKAYDLHCGCIQNRCQWQETK